MLTRWVDRDDMNQVCSLCDQSIERGSKHNLPKDEARRARQSCPYCREVGAPTCRLGEGVCTFECARCRARWMTKPD